MAAGNTYVPIATQTLGSNAASITFSSIPSTYTDLVLIANGLVTVNTDAPWLQFNSDTATNYSTTTFYANGTTALGANYLTQSKIFSEYVYGWYTSNNNTTIFNINNYANSTTYKTVLVRTTNTNAATSAAVGLWRNTAAITSIVILAGNSNFTSGSTFSLYGIASA